MVKGSISGIHYHVHSLKALNLEVHGVDQQRTLISLILARVWYPWTLAVEGHCRKDLYFLIKKAVSVRKHLDKNRKVALRCFEHILYQTYQNQNSWGSQIAAFWNRFAQLIRPDQHVDSRWCGWSSECSPPPKSPIWRGHNYRVAADQPPLSNKR